MNGESRRATKVDLRIGRRAWFGLVAAGLVGSIDALRGRQYRRLEGLGRLSDGELGEVVPLLDPRRRFRMAPGRLLVAQQRGGPLVELTCLTEVEAAALPLIDGRRTLADVAAQLSADRGLEPREAFCQVRSLFLRLAESLACCPRYA